MYIVFEHVSVPQTGHSFGELAKLLIFSDSPWYCPWIHITAC